MNLAGLKYYISNPQKIFGYLGNKGLLNRMSDEKYLKKIFKLSLGYELNLEKPRSFNEKLQWLKLNDRNPLYTELCDKYEVRKYVADKIGEKYLIPLVGGPWNNAEEIDFDKLPDKFV